MTLHSTLGRTGIKVPRIIFGTSYLGNLYRELSFGEKLELMKEWFRCSSTPVVIDTAGKYGAGLALEVIGEGMKELGIRPEEIIISNKLGWYRVPLTTPEPTFEPGAWKGLAHDCIQRFGYREIMECFEQGNELLGGTLVPALVSVHDPDEYLNASGSTAEWNRRFGEILESYRALFNLKEEGRVGAVGVGAKEWTVIRELYGHVPFDWVMLANSFTLFSHPPEVTGFMDELEEQGVGVINSALFHGGFLTGGELFDYRKPDPESEAGKRIFDWRDRFFRICSASGVEPWHACLQFGLSHPAISAVALNTSHPEKMKSNMEGAERKISGAFWSELKSERVIDPEYPFL